MRLAAVLACLVCVAEGFPQNAPNLDAVRYPALAAAVRVHGDVLISGGTFVSGPPLLREAALRTTGLLNAGPSTATAMVHFVLSGVILSKRTETIQKGDVFDRFFLRLLRIPTAKKIETQVCTEGPKAPANRIDSAKNPVEVWIYGNAPCIETTAD
jgi:hypothetical protein